MKSRADMTDGLDQKAGAAGRVCAHLDGCLGRLWLRRGEVGGDEACNRARTLPAWGSWPRGDSTGDAGSAGLVCPDDGCEQRRGETGEAGEIIGRERQLVPGLAEAPPGERQSSGQAALPQL